MTMNWTFGGVLWGGGQWGQEETGGAGGGGGGGGGRGRAEEAGVVLPTTGAVLPAAEAASTSEATIRPSGPEPATLARSTFKSLASFLAYGDATIRLPPSEAGCRVENKAALAGSCSTLAATTGKAGGGGGGAEVATGIGAGAGAGAGVAEAPPLLDDEADKAFDFASSSSSSVSARMPMAAPTGATSPSPTTIAANIPS